MKIGVNTLFLVPGDVGGTEIYFRQNFKRMVACNPDIDFVLFTSRDNQATLELDLVGEKNIEYVQIPVQSSVRPLRIIAEQVLLPLYVWKEGVDVLWSPGYTAPLICPCPQSVTIHDLQYKSHPEDLGVLERITLDFLVKNACRRCESIITVSEFSKRELLRYGFARSEKVSVVYEGVDPEFGTELDAEQGPITVDPPGTPYILCVAHTYPHKRVHLLVEAFGNIAEQIPHSLVLVGKARRGEIAVLESLAAVGTTRKRIVRDNSLTYEKLKAMYQGADLFVLPSEYEGFGLPILEAMLAGVPVITSDCASLPEVGGEHVCYVQKDNAGAFSKAILSVLCLDNRERQQIIRQQRERACTFCWDRSANETMKVLKKSGL